MALSESTYLRETNPRREVNIHHLGSKIQLKKYAEGISKQSPQLAVGRVYRIFHLEAEAFLCASCNEHKSKTPYLRQTLPDTRPTDPANATVKSLFVLEKPSRMEGGSVECGQKYRFRHLATGKYLTVNPSTVEKSATNGIQSFGVTLSHDKGSQSCFILHAADATISELSSSSDSPSVRIQGSQTCTVVELCKSQ